jgi:ethanolamine utilization protein EutN
MFIAKVVGNVWATRKHKQLTGCKMMLVKPINPADGAYAGETAMAVDAGVGSGVGDVVLVLDEGGSARKMLGNAKAPVRTVICGVVDEICFEGSVKKYA